MIRIATGCLAQPGALRPASLPVWRAPPLRLIFKGQGPDYPVHYNSPDRSQVVYRSNWSLDDSTAWVRLGPQFSIPLPAPGAGTAIGLDATFHRVWMDDLCGSDFTEFTAGAHVGFGWK